MINRVDDLHGDSYQIFWETRFSALWKGFLENIINDWKKILDFHGPVEIGKMICEPDLKARESDPVRYTKQRNIDLTQSLRVSVKLDPYGATDDFHVGQIPLQTSEGSFIFNGKERRILAQLTHSSGLQFQKENVSRKYKYKGQYYLVHWIIYRAQLIPSKGVWMEFNMYKLDRDANILSKLPAVLSRKLESLDGHVEVRIRRKYRFHNYAMQFALGFKEIAVPDVDDEEEWAIPSDETKQYGLIKRNWMEIAQCLDINIKDPDGELLKDDIIKMQIQAKLFDDSILSPLARYQINRRLQRLGDEYSNEVDTPHVTQKDIHGILLYLGKLYGGFDLPLDSRRSLANKRIRLIGDLMEEEVMPRVLFKLRRRVVRRLKKEEEKRTKVSEEQFIRILKECCIYSKFSEAVKEQFFITLAPLSALVAQNNILDRHALRRRITLFGPAGLQTAYVKDVRDIHWSHYGRLCPVDTPQSDRLGITLSVPLAARVNALGLLTAPYHEVKHSGGCITVSDDLKWLSAADEEDKDLWIAYFDQLESLKKGNKVLARNGSAELCQVDARSVGYIDSDPLQIFSLVPRMIPFIQHDDANRVLMACSAMRQAMMLKEKEEPLVKTSQEKMLAQDHTFWCYGRNLLLAYMPYKGLNFEDAIVVSESAARKLSAVHYDVKEIALREYVVWESKHASKATELKKRTVVRWETTADIPQWNRRKNLSDNKNFLDERGIIKIGSYVSPGDILVGVVDPYQKKTASIKMLAARSIMGKTISPWDHSLAVPHDGGGKVSNVEIYSKDAGDHLPTGVWKLVRVTLEVEKPLDVGDKLTNRHGGKGVVSSIISDEKMPYFLNPQSEHNHDGIGKHTHLEVIMNPLGVISRLNLGQLYEAHLGWSLKKSEAVQGAVVHAFSDSTENASTFMSANDKISEEWKEQKQCIYDPETKKALERPVTVGCCYILRLHHLASEKVHGRGFVRHGYNPVSEQPVQGKIHQGGQRMGEMEIWALQAYNAKKIIQETVTLKSDNPLLREILHKNQLKIAAGAELIPFVPEMLRVLYLFMFCMGLRLEFHDKEGCVLKDVFDSENKALEEIAGVSIYPVDKETCVRLAAGEVTDSALGTEKEGYSDHGLFSQRIFGPLVDGMCKCGSIIPSSALRDRRCDKCGVEFTKRKERRYKIGYIKLAYPVFNVIFLDAACKLLGLTISRMKDFLTENVQEPPLKFPESLDALLFLWMILNASETVKERIEKRLGLDLKDHDLTIDGLRGIFSGQRVNAISALQSKEIMEGVSAIDLIGKILKWLNLDNLEAMRNELREELESLVDRDVQKARQKQLRARLDIIRSFMGSNVDPASMMMDILPVLPPDLRQPFVTSKAQTVIGELNQLYMEVLWCNLDIIKKNKNAQTFKEDIRKLQRKISALIDNTRTYPPLCNADGRRYQQSLAHFLKGKKGFFRGNLLGKRVDYSGRAVIVPDPELKMDECGLPFAMAVKIFKPMILPRLRESIADGQETKKKHFLSYHEVDDRIKRTLETTPEHLKGTFRYKETQRDKKLIIDILNNLGRNYPVLLNRQPTLHRLGVQAFYFRVNHHNAVSMHPLVTAGFNADFDGDTIAVYRLVTSEALAEARNLLPSANVFSPANGSVVLNLGQDVTLGMYLVTSAKEGCERIAGISNMDIGCPPLQGKAFRKYLKEVLLLHHQKPGDFIDEIKRICFEKVTSSGISLAISDMPDLSAERDRLISENKSAEEMDRIVEEALANQTENPISIIKASGARGDIRPIRQVIAMRGKMERVVEEEGQVGTSDIWSSLREGMNLGEYFVSCYGSRTTLVDKKMGTAEAGYVTRQLVEMMHHIRVREYDCSHDKSAIDGLPISENRLEWLDMRDMNQTQLLDALNGKFISAIVWDIGAQLEIDNVKKMCDQEIVNMIRDKNPQKILLGVRIMEKRTKKELAGKLFGRILLSPVTIDGQEINNFCVDDEFYADFLADYILDNHQPLYVRTPLTCKTRNGVCQKCYGLDLSTKKHPEIGEKIGIIAAQSMGEPGTQLVLRTFHHGGVMGMAAISKDIPKVQRYLHANTLAQIINGYQYTEPLNYEELLDVIQQIYTANDVDLAGVHFEILLKTMMAKVEVTALNNPEYYPGQIIEKESWSIMPEANRPPVRQIICGINTLQRYPTSWLSSASFGGVINKLAMSAIEAKKDTLTGLKENTIIGKLIP